MKWAAGAGIAAVIVAIAAAQAEGDGPAVPAAPAKQERANWGEWTRPLQPHVDRPAAESEPPPPPVAETIPAEEIDVVDAHWMALTMWGEARNGGEAAMRAVGHVIDNRKRAGTHGSYATETVSAAWQFSAWNKNDPNYPAMMNSTSEARQRIIALLTAKRVADEILSAVGGPDRAPSSIHRRGVPRWSAGLAPDRVIGGIFLQGGAVNASPCRKPVGRGTNEVGGGV